MKQLYYICIILFFAQCNKGDENALNEYDLFGRLQAGSGIWKVESYDSFNNTSTSPSHSISEPSSEFYEFYIITKDLGQTLGDFNSSNYYKNDSITQLDVEAEKERVTFNPSLGSGDVWTVLENKRKKQVWSFTSGNTTTIMTLKKCNCELPKRKTVEVNG